MLSRASALHKKTFERLLAAVGVTVTLIFPPARTSVAGTSMANRVFGAANAETGDGETTTVDVIWSSDYLRPTAVVDGDVSEAVSSLARNGQQLDAVLRCRLSDVLINADGQFGGTLFDQVKEVEYKGQRFSVTGTKRTGLPPEGPYILWVGLSRVDKE